jgi:hypothetical protein
LTTYKNIRLFAFLLGVGFALNAHGQSSVLASGNWYKVAVGKAGVYKMSYDFLKKLGVDPGKVDPRNIKLYGNKGGMLPQPNSVSRPSDLTENAIFINGESDGSFDKADFILFYAEGADKVDFDIGHDIFYCEHNLYSDENFYFLTVGDTPGKRLETSNDLGTGFPVISSYNDFIFHEEDKYNDQQSGREWFGETLGVSSNELTLSFPIDGIAPDSQVKVVSDVMGQSYTASSFKLLINDVVIGEQKMLSIPNSRYGAKGIHKRDTFLVNSSTLGVAGKATQEVKYQFTKGTGFSKGYLDFMVLSFVRQLALYKDQTIFLSKESLTNPISQFQIASVNDQTNLWDVTDPYNVKAQSFSFGSGVSTFSTSTTNLKKFIAFNNTVPAPLLVGQVSNQDLHGISNANLVIVTNPLFLGEAQRLAAHRQEFSQWNVAVVTTDEVFNEFSSGRQDVSAIRDFMKHLRDKNATALKALLLFGKGSYDYKDRIQNNTNFVITYESRNSLLPLQTYSSDDYFGFLETNEGNWGEDPTQNHTLDIGVGRLPATSVTEAKNIVDKIIDYDTNKKNFGYWRKQLVFVADDGSVDDGFTSLHQYQADQLAQFIEGINPGADTRKLFMGTYRKTVKPNGESIASMTDDIVRAFDKGSLVINYTGHGNEKQWADENVFNDLTIAKLTNKFYPFLVTATCEFGRNDNPQEISSAEKCLTHEKGGAIGLVTTARPVNATTNFELNEAFYDALFQREGNALIPLGEVFRRTKNNSTSGVSNRNFILLGDPSLTLALPPNIVNVTSLKTAEGSDTLKALSMVTAQGEIQNSKGEKLSSFQGTVEATLFDKKTTIATVGKNNPPFSYSQWDNALFRGKATVSNGTFQFTFLLPKNIAYQIAPGKFSLYAVDSISQTDASGSATSFKIGGSETNSTTDNTPPSLRLFIGDTTFVNGGITNPDTYLVANLRDNKGINISSYGIGNSILGVLDNDAETMVLNDYYISNTDDYTSGWIRYPLRNLSPGKHRLTVKAWDVYNNASEAVVDFLVTDGEALVIEDFGNFPNPFRDNTMLFFTHNRSGDDLQAQVFIQSVTGEIVKTSEVMISASDYKVNLMEINAPGDLSKKLSSGVYLARLIVRSLTNGSKNEQVTKLIVLN